MRIFVNRTPFVGISPETTVVPAKLDSKVKLVRILMNVLRVIVMKMPSVRIQREATNAVVEKAIMVQVSHARKDNATMAHVQETKLVFHRLLLYADVQRVLSKLESTVSILMSVI